MLCIAAGTDCEGHLPLQQLTVIEDKGSIALMTGWYAQIIEALH